MCVIAIKPKNKTIDYKTIVNMFNQNPDGAGLAVICGKKTIITKGFMEVNEYWDLVNQMQNMPLVLHFRWATHGMINQEMCHPFIIDPCPLISSQIYAETENPIFIHNGIISGYGNDEISDTCDFATSVLSKLDSAQDMIRLLKTTYSKYVLIDQGKIHIIGKFYKYKGLTISNTDFIPIRSNKKYEANLRTREVSDFNISWHNDNLIFPRGSSSGKKR